MFVEHSVQGDLVTKPDVVFWHSLFPRKPNYPVIDPEWIHLNQNVCWMGLSTYEHSMLLNQSTISSGKCLKADINCGFGGSLGDG